MTSNTIPIIVCGKSPEVAKLVRKYLLPEYDAIHIIRSVQTGIVEIPLLLSGKTPSNTATNLGSQNYSQVARAVVAGGGFDDESFFAMKRACDDTPGVEKVPWLKLNEKTLRPGQSKEGGDGRQPPQREEVEAFCKVTAERVKSSLAREEVSGDGVWEY